jgi:hypothetical protein
VVGDTLAQIRCGEGVSDAQEWQNRCRGAYGEAAALSDLDESARRGQRASRGLPQWLEAEAEEDGDLHAHG